MDTYKTPRKLTPKEAAWVADLRRVMAACPKSLHLLTFGDADLQVIDAALAKGDLHDGHARRRGATLADVKTATLVHGVSG